MAAPPRGSGAAKNGDSDWVSASADVSMQNEKLYNRQRMDTFHTPSKLVRGGSPEQRSPTPTERPTSTPLSFDGRDERQYGHRLVDLVNNWNEDTRRMLREELATSLEPKPVVSPQSADSGGTSDLDAKQMLQQVLAEVRSLQPPGCDHCGALGRVAIAQEDLSEIVRGHLLMERASSRNSNSSPSETEVLQKLLTELTAAFGEMQQALKGSAALVEEVRHREERKEPENQQHPVGNSLNLDFLAQDLRQIKELLGTSNASGASLAKDIQQLKESVTLVQQKAEEDSQSLLKHVERLSDIVTASTAQDEESLESQRHKSVQDTLHQVTELLSVDHGRAEKEALLVRQSVTVLEAEVQHFKDSIAAAVQQSNQELVDRLSTVERSLTETHRDTEQKAAARLEMAHEKVDTIHQKAEHHAAAVADIKQEVLTVRDSVAFCQERLNKAPRQTDLTEAVRRTFEEMSKEFHAECAQLYMKPSFQVKFPESLNQDLQEIKQGIEAEKCGREETAAASTVELGRLEQEIQKTGQGLQVLEGAVKLQASELQHLQDVFAMLEGNFLQTLRQQLDRAAAAFSSTTAQFKSSFQKELQGLKESADPAAKSAPAELERPGGTALEVFCVCITVLEFVLHMASAFLELQSQERFFPALAVVIGPCLLNSVTILLFVSFLGETFHRWLQSNSRQRVLMLAVVRCEWLRAFGFLAPFLASAQSPWQRRRCEELSRAKARQLQRECDELKLAVRAERQRCRKELKERQERQARLTEKSGPAAAAPVVSEARDLEDLPMPEVPIFSEPMHGMAPGDASGEGFGAIQPQDPQMQRLATAPVRGNQTALRNRQWDDWLRDQKKQEARMDLEPSEGGRKSDLRGGVGQVYGVLPEAKGERVDPAKLPHGCLLCGIAPQSAEQESVSQFKKVLCLATLASALYADLPKVVVAAWLLSSDSRTESLVLRSAILTISGLYILWALAMCLMTLLERRLRRLRGDASHAVAGISLRGASVEAFQRRLLVTWQSPTASFAEGPLPDEILCAVQPLGQSKPSMLQRVPVSGKQGGGAGFLDLAPDCAYVVLLAPAKSGLLLGRPLRISCRTLPASDPASFSLRNLGPTWAEVAWSGGASELLLELKEGGADFGRRELVLGPVHCLWGLRPNTQYEVALGLVDAEPSLQLRGR
ncbi:unnamed protein product, partial [Effrenium voratum]